MGASTATPHVGLPQFSDNDKPTWRGDVNSAFGLIDNKFVDTDNALATKVDSTSNNTALNGKVAKGDILIRVNDAQWANPQAALDAAPAGARVLFQGNYVVPTGGFVLKSSGLTIDAMGATFTVNDWGTPAFLALRSNNAGDNNRYRIKLVTYAGTRGDHTGATLRGSAPYCSGCAVFTNGDRNVIEYVRTVGMPTPIFFSSYDGVSMNDRMGVGNRVEYLEAEGYDFGILYVMQTGFDWGNAYCHDDIDDSAGANPTHAIYCSGSDTYRAAMGVIGSWQVKNHRFGPPFIFKYQDDLNIDSLISTDSQGIVRFQDCNDISVNQVIAIRSISTANQGALAMGFTTAMCQRLHIGAVKISAVAGVNERLVSLYADTMTIDSMILISNRTVQDTNNGEVVIRGNKVSITKLKTIAAGTANALAASMGQNAAGDCNDCTISDIEALNAVNPSHPVTVFATSINAKWARRSDVIWGSAAPTTGTWNQGAEVHNYAATVGAPKAWICTVAGSPGTWVSTGNL